MAESTEMFPLESFVFYRSFRDAIEEMDDSDKLATLLAICDYALYNVEPELTSPMSRAIFTVAKPSIESNRAKRKNGSKGGRPRKTSNVKAETCGFEEKNQWFSETESTETETETEAETETVSETGADTNTADKPPARSGFTPPTVDEVRSYCQERGNNVDPQRFLDYYGAMGWMRGKTQLTDWRAAVRSWENNGIPNQRSDVSAQGQGYTPGPIELAAIQNLQNLRDSLSEGDDQSCQ